MSLDALLARLEARDVTSVTSHSAADVTPDAAPTLARTSVTSVTGKNGDAVDKAAHEPLSNPKMDARRQRGLAMLAASPSARYALVTDLESEPGSVLLTLAIRDRATCELRIPREKYDPFLLRDLIGKQRGTVH